MEEIYHLNMMDIVKTLKRKITSRFEEISSKRIKETISNIPPPLTHIINRSLNTGVVPDQIKLAKVIPVFKVSDANELNNYRRIR